MKTRTKGFLTKWKIAHNAEQFDYIVELHDYLWRFIRAELPGSNGHMEKYLDVAIEQSENRRKAKVEL